MALSLKGESQRGEDVGSIKRENTGRPRHADRAEHTPRDALSYFLAINELTFLTSP